MRERFILLPTIGFAAALACSSGRTQGPVPAEAAPVPALGAELREIFSDPALDNAHWGVMVQSVESGELIYRENATKLFMPGSNVKLVTAAVALASLGIDHRFQTAIAASDQIQEGGTLSGDLIVIGGGDPTLSERFFAGDPLAVFRNWADSLKSLGVTHIAGDVVGDDDLFDDVHLGPGWSWDDLGYYYAAEVGALLYNEGAVRARVSPGDSVGALANVRLDPPTVYLTVQNDVVTVADSTGVSVTEELRPFSNDGRLWGEIWIGRDSLNRFLAPHDPTLFFVTVLAETLQSEGISIGGRPADADSFAPGGRRASPTTLFVQASPTLAEIVKPFLKESQNQIGEMLLRYLGAADSDTGSIEAGRRVVERTLTAWGIPESYYIYVDGSGLSRYNYISPEALVRLLRVMARRPEFEAYYDALPIAGVDGTLEQRMRGSRAAGNARAKTGYISNARALSGYVTTADGELLAFSMIANNFDTSIRTVEYLQDLAVERLASFTRASSR